MRDNAASDPVNVASRRSPSSDSKRSASRMTPYLITSAIPDAISSTGSDESVPKSTNTRCGCRNAPTRFFPADVSTPVLPPTLLSTIASSVVGTWTQGIPRKRVAATNPATSPTTPPPTAMTLESRPYPRSISRSCRSATVSRVLNRSPAGNSKHWASPPSSLRA